MFFDPVKRFAILSVTERAAARTQTSRLGLYAVKEIVAAHNGDVTVTSGAKEGIILTMRRPRTTPHRRNSNLSEQTADTPAESIIG